MNLADVKISRVSNAVAAGTTEIDGTAVDMTGYEWVIFLIAFGTITANAVTSVKAQQGTASNGSDGADLAGTACVVADDQDNKVVALEVNCPQQSLGKYVRPVVVRGTANAVVDGIIAIRGNGRVKPVSFDTSLVATSKQVNSPALGTA